MSDETQTPPTEESTEPREGQGTEQSGDTSQVDLDKFEGEKSIADPQQEKNSANPDDLAAVYDVPVQVSAVLGRANMQVNQLLKMGRGAVIELDRKVGEAIDVYVNNRLVARGEVVVVDDHLGITMTEIIKADKAS